MNNSVHYGLRARIIGHLQTSGIKSVDTDLYFQIAVKCFSSTGTEIGNFEKLPLELVDLIEEQHFPLKEYRDKAIYISKMLLNIKNNICSDASFGVSVQCPDCGRFCALAARNNHSGGEQESFYYHCTCGNSVNAHRGDKWPQGVPASYQIRLKRNEIQKRIFEMTKSNRSISKKWLLGKVAKVIRSPSNDIAQVGMINSLSKATQFIDALETVYSRHLSTFQKW